MEATIHRPLTRRAGGFWAAEGAAAETDGDESDI
jgi:hypothetical protein